MNEEIEMLMYTDATSENTYCAPNKWWATKRGFRPTHKVKITVLSELPPCPHKDVHHGMNGNFTCNECGVEMEPTGFQIKAKR